MLNCTPHDILFINAMGEKLVVPRSNYCIRLTESNQKKYGQHESLRVPIVSTPVYDGMTGAPEDTTQDIIVSMPVGQEITAGRIQWKGNVFGPDLSPTGVIRDENGRILGTKRLIRYSP